MGKRTLGHVGITVADLDRSVRFYCDVLGLRLRAKGEIQAHWLGDVVGAKDAHLRFVETEADDGTVVELFEYVSPVGAPLSAKPWDAGSVHVALMVSDLERLWDRLIERGAVARSERPVLVSETPPSLCGYVLDPDGVHIELCQPLE